MIRLFEEPGPAIIKDTRTLELEDELVEASVLLFSALDKTVHALAAAVAAVPPEKVRAARVPLPKNATVEDIAAKKAAVQELFDAQKEIFLNSELGASQLALWASAYPEATDAYLYPELHASASLTEQDAGLVAFFTEHPQLKDKSPAEKKEMLEKLRITQEDETNVAELNDILKNDPTLFAEILRTLIEMQVKIRAQAGLAELQEKQERQHIDIVVKSTAEVTQGSNPFAVIMAALHDIDKHRPNSAGVAVMNLFTHEETSQIAAADSIQRVLTAKLLNRGGEGSQKIAAMILSAAKATSIIVAHHGHGEFPRGRAYPNDEYIPQIYQGIIGVPEAQFAESLYPHTPDLDTAIPANFPVIRETAALLNALDAATGCLVEAFAKNNNTYSNQEVAETDLLVYLTQKLANSFEGNLAVPGAQLLLITDSPSEASEQLRAFQEGLKENKKLYTAFVAADISSINPDLSEDTLLMKPDSELTRRESLLKKVISSHLGLKSLFTELVQQKYLTKEEVLAGIAGERGQFNRALTVYIEALATDVASAKENSTLESALE